MSSNIDSDDDFQKLLNEIPVDYDQKPSRKVEPPKPELLTIKLLKSAIRDTNTDNSIESQIIFLYAEHILPGLFTELIGTTAKGGEFMERRAANNPEKDYSEGESWSDQSQVSHLLNGLLPTLRIIRAIREDVSEGKVSRYLCKRAVSLFVAGYTLHDWNKFPEVEKELNLLGFNDNNKINIIRDQKIVHKILTKWIGLLGIEKFLKEAGFDDPKDYLDVLAWIATNTQVKYDTALLTNGLNLSALPDRARLLVTDFSRLSDLFVSIVTHPSRIDSPNIHELIFKLSEGKLEFSWHQLAENRGLLTNVINNALLEAHQEVNYKPLLYFPHGAVYIKLVENDKPKIDIEQFPGRVVSKIKQLCANQIENRLIGFGRKKGLEFAPYYWNFFSPSELVRIGAKATFIKINENKPSKAVERGNNLISFQKKGFLKDLDLNFEENICIDQLAEYCALVEGNIVNKAEGFICETDFDIAKEIITFLELTNVQEGFNTVSNLNKAIRESGESGATGGVPLNWYYVANQYIKKRNPKPSEIRQVIDNLAERLAALLSTAMIEQDIDNKWVDILSYVRKNVFLRGANIDFKSRFITELTRYENAKGGGRKGSKVCSLCSSDSEISEQIETAVLFQPQVYTNRQVLFSGQAKRHICKICSIETMLRQILMNSTQMMGKKFEDQKYRYLFFYPTYFFTPETAEFLRVAYSQIKQINFKSVRDELIKFQEGKVNFQTSDFQCLGDLLLKVNDIDSDDIDELEEDKETIDKIIDEDEEENAAKPKDRVFRIHYPDNTPITFFFMGLDPGRVPAKKKPSDTQSWVMPTLLSLVLPLVFDVKVIVSESPIPIHTSAIDFPETVFLDAPHQTLALLTKKKALRRNHILPTLQRLIAAYTIHLDVNSSTKDYYNWGALTGMVRDLETSSLYVFDFLNRWLRKQDKLDITPYGRREIYFTFYKYFEPNGGSMSQAIELVKLYRKFYRAKSRNAKSNAILKPIEVAARTLIETRKSGNLYNSKEALSEVVASEVAALMQRVHNRNAEGKPTLVFLDGKWRRALSLEQEREQIAEFASYFVNNLFFNEYKGDRTRLTGKQLNLLKSVCEFLYRCEDDLEKAQNKVTEEEPEEVISEEVISEEDNTN